MNNNRNNRRRSRGNRNQGGGNAANRIDSRARGNAPQLLDKYKKLAQDAQHNGDRVQAEYYFQFADHYFRVIADNKARQEEARAKRDEERQQAQGGRHNNQRDNQRDHNQQDNSQRDDGQDDAMQADGGKEDRRPRRNSRTRRDAPEQAPVADMAGDGAGHSDENEAEPAKAPARRKSSTPRTGTTRRTSTTKASPRKTAKSDDPSEAAGDNGEEKPAPKRTRKPRKAASTAASANGDAANGRAEIDVAALPPAIGNIEDEAKPAPKPAPRRRKAASGDDETVQAAE